MPRVKCKLFNALVWLGSGCSQAPNADPTPQSTTSSSFPSELTSSTMTTEDPTSSGPAVTSRTTGSIETTGLTEVSGSSDDTTGGPACDRPGGCDRLDVLLVIDNSGSMGEKQRRFVAALPHVLAGLRGLVDRDGVAVEADINLMVTTTDIGHPLCEVFQKPGYEPAKGAPISTSCTERLERFNSINADETMPDICTDACPVGQSAAPTDSYIHFAGLTHNVIAAEGVLDPVERALACIVPQGIDGCGFEAPLEAMLLALDGGAVWNQGPRPFLREGAALAVVLLSDEMDCSIEDLKYFDPAFKDHPEFGKYYEVDPNTMKQAPPTSAICWNGGMTCSGPDANGLFESCMAQDAGVLWPMARYQDFLGHLSESGKPTFMLVIGGVPSVTAHGSEAPHEPISGGLEALTYHDWSEADLLQGDEDSSLDKQIEFGIGPGCSKKDIGYGIPPGRTVDVCQSLDSNDEIGCCVESVCDDDLRGAMDCLTGMASLRLLPQR